MGPVMPVIFYDSLGEFSKSLPERGYSRTYEADYDTTRDAWSGNQTYAEAKVNLWRGDAESLKQSSDILDQIEADGIELAQSFWDHDRTGAIPCVPSFLAGSPDSMRRLQEFQSENSPIRIYVDMALSGGFSSKQLATRGAALLALARKLQVIRPVELCLFASMYGKSKDATGDCAIPVIRIDASPLDLTTASYAFVNPAFFRQLCFGWGRPHGYDGTWAWSQPPGAWTRKKLRGLFSLAENDLLVDGAYLTDELMRDPVQWVNDQVRKYADTIDAA